MKHLPPQVKLSQVRRPSNLRLKMAVQVTANVPMMARQARLDLLAFGGTVSLCRVRGRLRSSVLIVVARGYAGR